MKERKGRSEGEGNEGKIEGRAEERRKESSQRTHINSSRMTEEWL